MGTIGASCASARGFLFTNLTATIDSHPIPRVSQYLVTSPLFRFTVPGDNIIGVPAGSGYGVAKGAFLMTAPLSPGQHTMHLHGEAPDYGLVYDWDYIITVTP